MRPLLRPLVVLLATLGVLGCGRGVEAPRHLILISIDTLRADHLGCYGHDRPTSPNLDRLARDGVLFEDVLAPSPWTLPSHASLLTGRYPSRHGVRTMGDALAADVPTLATALGLQGFATGAVVNAIYLTEYYGLAQGFAHLETLKPVHGAEGAAPDITQRALRWLARRDDRPFFLFLHYFDVHSDYRSRPDYEDLFVEERGRLDGSTAQLMAIAGDALPVGAEDAEHLARLYDAGIRQLDDELGRLFAWLRERGMLEEALLVVTSDHGEEFLEHGGVLHGKTQYQEQLHVPLILRGPGVPAGVRVADPVSLVDVAPTLLALLDVPPLAELEGIDLRPLWQRTATRASGRTLFAEAAPAVRGTHRRAVREGRWKLIVDGTTRRRELYDLASDPREERNLVEAQPGVARRLEAALEAFLEAQREAPPAPELSEEDRERLRSLGYL